MKRCPTPDCGAKVHPRATYCSTICRNAHEGGRSRVSQLRLEMERDAWSWEEFNRRAGAATLLCLDAD